MKQNGIFPSSRALRPPLSFLAMLVLLFAVSCARTREMRSPLELGLSLNQEVYRPGEMVRCTVELVNVSDRDQAVFVPFLAAPSAVSNLRFQFGEKNGGAVVKRDPVFPKRGIKAEKTVLGPGEKVSRRFGFVHLTQRPGDFLLQAYFSPLLLEPTTVPGPVISPVAIFRVEGETLWERDRDGVLVEEEAVRLAREAFRHPASSGQATLVENELGLLEWWVTLQPESEDSAGTVSPVKFRVDPYGAFVR
ncbi:hypothetical protein HQ520_12955 [bacterium]|nr:hypothetical protein [bacterium]